MLFAPLAVSPESGGKVVAALFGLTEAERRIFENVADGLTVQETAEKLGIGVSTVRTHLLRVFEKTDTGRQAELVSLAGEFAKLVRELV